MHVYNGVFTILVLAYFLAFYVSAKVKLFVSLL